jgi:hypothetical protein
MCECPLPALRSCEPGQPVTEVLFGQWIRVDLDLACLVDEGAAGRAVTPNRFHTAVPVSATCSSSGTAGHPQIRIPYSASNSAGDDGMPSA